MFGLLIYERRAELVRIRLDVWAYELIKESTYGIQHLVTSDSI